MKIANPGARKANAAHFASSRDAARWASVLARDKSQDGKFFYAVATTGVYCRPSCPSRHANWKNVTFHDTCAAAQAAGFRACKRCRPHEAGIDARNSELVAKACRDIETAGDMPKLADLATASGLSPFHFHRLFKSLTGVTPKAYAIAFRHTRVRENLAGTATVTDAIYDAGFNSAGRFYATSNKILGMSPKTFRAGGTDTLIRFAIGQCSLGAILVAASDKGICAVLLGDDAEALLRVLQDRFPKANLIGGDTDFESLTQRVIAHVENPVHRFDLPLDVQGTAFQHRVWQALRDIPAGKTRSYLEVASSIGRPQAVRAVARACGANPAAIVIPCHRVVRTDGALSGYRWGIERKKELLAREASSGGASLAKPTKRGRRDAG
ncbi:MAG: bifunctional DNA-binding transcriptional regulator/O6-methylguanine-DNA methyltransferase Ada [Hyphomicrobium sp.]